MLCFYYKFHCMKNVCEDLIWKQNNLEIIPGNQTWHRLMLGVISAGKAEAMC